MSTLRNFFLGGLLILISASFGLGLWYFRHTSSLATTVLDSNPLPQTASGNTNVAILGIGGEGHEGADLTDTILILTLNRAKPAKIISIPRDVWLDSLQTKINAVYYYAKQQDESQALARTKSALSELLGQPIHYAAMIDFNGFIKLIDILGGITVNVPNTFDDYKYPIPGQENAIPESLRYEHLHFEAGSTQLDGVTALKFARSRHAEGVEGTDFARSERQKLIIEALKSKIFSSNTLLNFETLSAIFNNLQSSVKTDIQPADYRGFFELALKLKNSNSTLQTAALTSYLTNPPNLKPYGGAWVLIPSAELKSYVATFLDN